MAVQKFSLVAIAVGYVPQTLRFVLVGSGSETEGNFFFFFLVGTVACSF